jgi:hypothetical protein
VEKYCTAGQATDGNIIQNMCFPWGGCVGVVCVGVCGCVCWWVCVCVCVCVNCTQDTERSPVGESDYCHEVLIMFSAIERLVPDAVCCQKELPLCAKPVLWILQGLVWTIPAAGPSTAPSLTPGRTRPGQSVVSLPSSYHLQVLH